MAFIKNQKLILKVPYYSQHKNVKDKNWRNRSCGIVCLKMVLEYWGGKINRKTPSIKILIKENEFIGGFGNFGSNHEALVMLARNYGFQAYRQEFRSLTNNLKNQKVSISVFEKDLINDGIKKIIGKLEKSQPVIVSVVKNFSELDKPHLIVLTGFEKIGGKLTGFYYHDPDFKNKIDGMNNFTPIKKFIKYWRKFSIFVNI